jgi:hypothetical protein
MHTIGNPNQLNSKIPIRLIFKCFQDESMSPVHFAANFPVPAKLERVKTNARFPLLRFVNALSLISKKLKKLI